MIDLLEIFRSRRLVAVLRAPDADRFVPAAKVLYEAGITCLEFTLTTRGALDAIRDARKALPGDALVGAGTVRTAQHVDDAIDAGAGFLVSQTFKPDLVDAAHRRDVPFMPGTLTPTEILAAWEHGVPAVKISPVGPVGALEYLSEVLAPLPDVPVVPSGGVTLEAAADYLRRGAAAVGVSRALVLDALAPGGDLDALAERTRTVVASVAAA